jgi:hypothetical protein
MQLEKCVSIHLSLYRLLLCKLTYWVFLPIPSKNSPYSLFLCVISTSYLFLTYVKWIVHVLKYKYRQLVWEWLYFREYRISDLPIPPFRGMGKNTLLVNSDMTIFTLMYINNYKYKLILSMKRSPWAPLLI